MGRNPQYFHWEEILNIFNAKKSLLLLIERNFQYFLWEEILDISNGKKFLIFSIGSEAPLTPDTPATPALLLHDISHGGVTRFWLAFSGAPAD